ncbi:DMT family transporter [Thioalkalivibrio sp. ALE23]|uniref:DMT family transporter n=1 Tax=Thioalkalivibrio sp. ALE23 TaxID=1265495 RepID=UPI000370CB59|nr:DMT family transporter [Thioalkalivibrio sp. ALE23]
MIRNLSPHATGALFAFIGVMAISFDGLLVRLADASAPDILFWRGLFMAITLTVVLRLMNGRWSWACMRRGGMDAWWTATGFAATNYLFVLAVLHTTVANAVVILAASPLFAALFSGLILREWIPLRTWVAILLSLVGIVGVFAGSLETGGWLGDLFALGAAMVVGLKLTLLRRSPQIDRLAVIATGGLLGAVIALFFAAPLAVSATRLATLLLMGAVQLPLALVMIALATRHLPAGEVALFLVLEAVFGTLWVWLFLAEAPPLMTLVAGTAVLVTLALHALASWRDEAH